MLCNYCLNIENDKTLPNSIKYDSLSNAILKLKNKIEFIENQKAILRLDNEDHSKSNNVGNLIDYDDKSNKVSKSPEELCYKDISTDALIMAEKRCELLENQLAAMRHIFLNKMLKKSKNDDRKESNPTKISESDKFVKGNVEFDDLKKTPLSISMEKYNSKNIVKSSQNMNINRPIRTKSVLITPISRIRTENARPPFIPSGNSTNYTNQLVSSKSVHFKDASSICDIQSAFCALCMELNELLEKKASLIELVPSKQISFKIQKVSRLISAKRIEMEKLNIFLKSQNFEKFSKRH